MYAKIKYVDGVVSYVNIKEHFELAPVEKMLQDILQAEIYTDSGKRVAVRKRKHQKKYIADYKRFRDSKED